MPLYHVLTQARPDSGKQHGLTQAHLETGDRTLGSLRLAPCAVIVNEIKNVQVTVKVKTAVLCASVVAQTDEASGFSLFVFLFAHISMRLSQMYNTLPSSLSIVLSADHGERRLCLASQLIYHIVTAQHLACCPV